MKLRRNWLFPLGVLGGILSASGTSLPVAAGTLFAGVAAVAWLLRRSGRLHFLPLLLLGVAAGRAAVALNAMRPEHHLQTLLHHHDRRAEARFRIADPAMAAPVAEDEPEHPVDRMAEVLAVRFDGESAWRPTTGRVRLRGSTKLFGGEPEDGATVECAGVFLQSRPPVRHFLHRKGRTVPLPELGENSFDAYRAARGLCADFRVESCRARPREKPSSGARLRRRLMERIDRGIDDPERAALLNALTLGVRSSLTPGVRVSFRRSGIAHLFSVSGLHVGILAMLILLLLRPVPFGFRAGAVLTLMIYVWVTGGNAPALRAFLLVAAIAVLRERLLSLPGLELLAWIGTLLLLANPAFLGDAGFQYSFVITGFLLLAAAPAREAAAAARGALPWMPDAPRRRQWAVRLRGKLAAAFFVAVAASLSGAMLSLHHQHYFFPGAFLINFLLLPVLAPIFLLALAKCAMPFADAVWNFLLNRCFDYLDGLISLAQACDAGRAPLVPGYGSVLLYGILLALALKLAPGRKRLAAALGALFVLGFFLLAPGRRPITAAVITGGTSEAPMLAVLDPAAGTLAAVNATTAGVYPLRNLAEHCAVRRMEFFAVAPNRAEAVRSVTKLDEALPVESVFVPEAKVRSQVFRELLAPFPLRLGSGENAFAELEYTPDCWRLRADTAPAAEIELRKRKDGTWRVRIGEENFTVPASSTVRLDLAEVR